MRSAHTLDDLLGLLWEHGSAWYGQERVSQIQHALQCAWLAEQAGAGDALITAALFHDIAHLTHHLGEDCALRGVDDRHEHAGAQILTRWFAPEVTAPVALHVDAKRYLCAMEPEYAEGLSAASLTSLQLQGGIFDPEEAHFFIRIAHAEDAVRLRRWDDAAKDPAAQTPDLAHFAAIARRIAIASDPVSAA